MTRYVLLVLRDAFVLPGQALSEQIGRPQSVLAIEHVPDGGELIVARQRDPDEHGPGPSDLHQVGTLARIEGREQIRPGVFQVTLKGLERCAIVSFAQTSPFFEVEAEVLESTGDETAHASLELDRLVEELAIRARIATRATFMASSSSGLRQGAIHALASSREIEATERKLGYPLPTVVREVYTRVANGGFGPGYGLLGLLSGERNDLGDTAIETWEAWCQPGKPGTKWENAPLWPNHLLPVAPWGCGIYSCIDLSSAQGRVLRYEGDMYLAVLEGKPADDGEPMKFEDLFWEEAPSFVTWLRSWLDDTLEF